MPTSRSSASGTCRRTSGSAVIKSASRFRGQGQGQADSPLGRGFLAGTLTRAEELPAADFRRNQPRLQGENYDQNMALVARLRGLATRVGASPAQIALAWLLGQGPDVVPIFGTTRRTRLRENLASVPLKLASCDQFLLDQTFAPDTVSGARYNEAGLALLDRS